MRSGALFLWSAATCRRFGLGLTPHSLKRRNDDDSVDQSRPTKSADKSAHSKYAPVAQLEECDASNVEVAGSSPARSSNIADFRLPIADLVFSSGGCFHVQETLCFMKTAPIGNLQLAIGNDLRK
jgi:hypothetical protein